MIIMRKKKVEKASKLSLCPNDNQCVDCPCNMRWCNFIFEEDTLFNFRNKDKIKRKENGCWTNNS